MPKDISQDQPTTRRYSAEEKQQQCGWCAPCVLSWTMQGTVKRVAEQVGYGTESVRTWVKQADVDDGNAPGVTTEEAARMLALELENRELLRANEILKRASFFFGAELDRQHKW